MAGAEYVLIGLRTSFQFLLHHFQPFLPTSQWFPFIYEFTFLTASPVDFNNDWLSETMRFLAGNRELDL